MFFGAYDGFGLAGQHGGRGRAIAQKTLPCQPILETISVKLSHLPSFITLKFWNELKYRNAEGRVSSADDRSTCVNISWAWVQELRSFEARLCITGVQQHWR